MREPQNSSMIMSPPSSLKNLWTFRLTARKKFITIVRREMWKGWVIRRAGWIGKKHWLNIGAATLVSQSSPPPNDFFFRSFKLIYFQDGFGCSDGVCACTGKSEGGLLLDKTRLPVSKIISSELEDVCFTVGPLKCYSPSSPS